MKLTVYNPQKGRLETIDLVVSETNTTKFDTCDTPGAIGIITDARRQFGDYRNRLGLSGNRVWSLTGIYRIRPEQGQEITRSVHRVVQKQEEPFRSERLAGARLRLPPSRLKHKLSLGPLYHPSFTFKARGGQNSVVTGGQFSVVIFILISLYKQGVKFSMVFWLNMAHLLRLGIQGTANQGRGGHKKLAIITYNFGKK